MNSIGRSYFVTVLRESLNYSTLFDMTSNKLQGILHFTIYTIASTNGLMLSSKFKHQLFLIVLVTHKAMARNNRFLTFLIKVLMIYNNIFNVVKTLASIYAIV